MDINFKIKIVDVGDQPVNATDIIISNSSLNLSEIKVTDNLGEVSFSFPDTNIIGTQLFTIKVSNIDFQKSEFRVSTDGYFNDRLTKVTLTRNNTTIRLDIIFKLGKVREAPTIFIKESDIKNLTKPVDAILLKDPRDYAYRFLEPRNVDNFHYLDENDICGDINQNEWKRMHYKSSKVHPETVGRFRWLEYRFSSALTFLVAVWIPGRPSKTTDYFIFYSPTTAGKTEYKTDIGKAPYGLKKHDEYGYHQPFVQLGHGYLSNDKYIIHQTIAATKKIPVIVLPINNEGKVNFFDGDTNTMRSLKEINMFIQRRNYSSYSHIESVQLDKQQFTVKPSVPNEIGQIIVGAFSEGYNRLASLLIGNNGEFQKKWTHIWDVDSAVLIYGGWDSYLTNLKRWFSKDPEKKRFQLLHSDFTDGGTLINSLPTYFQDLMPSKPKLGTVQKNGGRVPIQIHEKHEKNNKWSVIHFSDSALTWDVEHQNVEPEFRDSPHHFVPKIGIGYAASKYK